VTAANYGDVAESFCVKCYYDNKEIGSKRVCNLPPGESTSLTFNWDTKGVPVNHYLIKAWADSGEEIDESDEENNWCRMKVPIFVIPELQLGTITAVVSMLAAYILFRARKPRLTAVSANGV
jgi:hypothetical protein